MLNSVLGYTFLACIAAILLGVILYPLWLELRSAVSGLQSKTRIGLAISITTLILIVVTFVGLF